MMNLEVKKSLDKLSDDELLYTLSIQFGYNFPIWEECEQEEYEEHCGSDNSTLTELMEKYLDTLFSNVTYRKEPYWKNGGGILDAISGKEPDGYNYYKSTKTEFTIVLGSELIDYVNNRKPSWLNKKDICKMSEIEPCSIFPDDENDGTSQDDYVKSKESCKEEMYI